MQLNERIFTEINGLQQGMFLQSEDLGNPVLLFLHGGPGSPEIAFTQSYPTGLEKLFTVCWWEQRGSGITYRKDTLPETLTMEQMIADAIAVAKMLCQRFGKEKVYLMGHSWGSVLGVLTAARAPELFYAYIGMGQVARQEKSERLAYAYMLDEFRAAGDKKMVRKLEQLPIDKGHPIDMKYLGLRSVGMCKLGIGIMRNSRSMLDNVMIVLRFKGYSWRERFNYPRGSMLALKHLWGAVMDSDFTKQVPKLEIPAYVFQGRWDYQVSYKLAKAYWQVLEAPVKGFYTFEESAHSPCFEEPERMCRILQEDVLQGKASLADTL